MSDLMQIGLDMLHGVRRASMSTDAVYSRGGVSVTVPAATGSYQYEVATPAGTLIAAHVLDFVVTAADLLLGDAVVEPMLGDRIVIRGQTYEVLDITPGECWRWNGPPGAAYRIHTKEVE